MLLLRKEIVTIYSATNPNCLLNDNAFVLSLAFLADVLSYINNMNVTLQGKALIVSYLYRKVREFCVKCCLLTKHILQQQYFHFSQLSALLKEWEIKPDDIPYLDIAVFDALDQEFSARLGDF